MMKLNLLINAEFLWRHKLMQLCGLFLLLFSFSHTEVLQAQDHETSSINNPGQSPKHLILTENSRIDSILATVNGSPITLRDVILESRSAERVLAGVYSGERLYNETIKVRLEILENIIFRRLVYHQYLKNPFTIPEQEVENLLESFMANAGINDRKDFEKQAEAFDTSLPDLRQKLREKLAVDILLAQYCDRTVSVTPKQIFEEYEKHPERWSIPAQIRLQMIQLKYRQDSANPDSNPNIGKIKNMLNNADLLKFQQVAKEYSDIPLDENNSKTLLNVKDLRPEFQKAVENKNVGDVLGPISTPEAVYFIRIAELRSACKKSFSSVSREISQMLHKAAIAEKRKQYRSQLQESAVIRYFF